MSQLASPDPFAEILTTTDAHRAEHGCGAYPYDKGTLLGVLAAAVNARRTVRAQLGENRWESGCGAAIRPSHINRRSFLHTLPTLNAPWFCRLFLASFSDDSAH